MGSLYTIQRVEEARRARSARREGLKPNGIARRPSPANDMSKACDGAWQVTGWAVVGASSLAVWALLFGAAWALTTAFAR